MLLSRKQSLDVRSAENQSILVSVSLGGSALIPAGQNGGTSIRKPLSHIRLNAQIAVRKYKCVVRTSENTVPNAVTLQIATRLVTEMSDFWRALAYQSAMMQAQLMLKKGIIDREDLVLIENKLADQYGFKIGSWEREIDLINLAFRANMGETRE